MKLVVLVAFFKTASLKVTQTPPSGVNTLQFTPLSLRCRRLQNPVITSPRLNDVPPTSLYAIGPPMAGDFACRARTEILSEGFRPSYPLQTIPTWGESKAGVGQSFAIDEELVDQLLALGLYQLSRRIDHPLTGQLRLTAGSTRAAFLMAPQPTIPWCRPIRRRRRKSVR
jgi:hypothetical protein